MSGVLVRKILKQIKKELLLISRPKKKNKNLLLSYLLYECLKEEDVHKEIDKIRYMQPRVSFFGTSPFQCHVLTEILKGIDIYHREHREHRDFLLAAERRQGKTDQSLDDIQHTTRWQ